MKLPLGSVLVDSTGDGIADFGREETFANGFDKSYDAGATWRVRLTGFNTAGNAISFSVTCPGPDEHGLDIALSGSSDIVICDDGSTVKVVVD